MNLHLLQGHVTRTGDQSVKPPKSQIKWYVMHPSPDPLVSHPGKSVNKWSCEISPLNSSFTRISKTLSGVSPCSRALLQDILRKWEKSLKEATVIANKAAAFNRCVNKVHEDMQDQIKTLYSQSITKGKSSQKMDKVLTELRDLSAFQQNIIFELGKSMQHMADTIFVHAANLTLVRRD